MRIIFVGLTFFCLFHFSQSIFGQDKPVYPYIAPSNDSGEMASSFIDIMMAEAKERNERIFIIVRTGTNEKEIFTAHRLRSTKRHFLYKKIDLKNFVFAQGERTKGKGRIEFYLGNELRLILLANRHRMPNLTCCPV